nr:hypothetical protein [Tanacetum cinerariifolium]
MDPVKNAIYCSETKFGDVVDGAIKIFTVSVHSFCWISNQGSSKSKFYVQQESSEFCKILFEEAIGSIRAIAASHLWQDMLPEYILVRIPGPFFLLDKQSGFFEIQVLRSGL